MNHSPTNWKEVRRLQAWCLKPQGWSPRQIAAALGVSEAAVSQWIRRVREGGVQALRHRRPPGAPRRLSTAQLARLPERLHRGPEADPVYAPELNPDEGFWAHLKGVELRKLCCFDLHHLRRERRTAVTRVRHKPPILTGCCAGAGL